MFPRAVPTVASSPDAVAVALVHIVRPHSRLLCCSRVAILSAPKGPRSPLTKLLIPILTFKASLTTGGQFTICLGESLASVCSTGRVEMHNFRRQEMDVPPLHVRWKWLWASTIVRSYQISGFRHGWIQAFPLPLDACIPGVTPPSSSRTSHSRILDTEDIVHEHTTM